jgi:hypothetical protein
LTSHFLLACSGVEFEAGSTEPHLALAFGFADKLSREADTRGEVRITLHLQYNVVDDVVHGCWWRQELRKRLRHGCAHDEKGLRDDTGAVLANPETKLEHELTRVRPGTNRAGGLRGAR